MMAKDVNEHYLTEPVEQVIVHTCRFAVGA